MPVPTALQRQGWLRTLRGVIHHHRDAIAAAISRDFGNRSPAETLHVEILAVLQEIDFTLRRLARWMRPSRRSVGLIFQPARARVVPQPLGVVGIVAPWNFPVFLAAGPLVGALAAGNRVMIKTSEYCPETSRLFRELIAAAFPDDLVAVVNGDADVARAFTRLPFDHLLFTGSTAVGRQVMRAAAEHLTPVTLELGGKSPAIVSRTVPLADAAERLAFGKTLNAGQSCVAPDYVLVPDDRVDAFVDAFRNAVVRLFPTLPDNPDYTSVIDDRQVARIEALVGDAVARGAQVLPMHSQGQGRRLPLRLLLGVDDGMKVMQDELFGPLLVVVPYQDLDGAIAFINRRPRPLALYYFGYDRAEQRRVVAETRSGGVCINDTTLQVGLHDAPFGGIGASGMGHYHGHEGFLTFSKARTVLTKGRFSSARFAYPPYQRWLPRLIRRLFVR